MTEKERLEIIKDKQLYMHSLSTFDIDWLIQQTERVQELEVQLERKTLRCSNLTECLWEKDDEIKMYREALEKTQIAIQENLKRAHYKDEVILYEAYKQNEELLNDK